MGALPKKKTSTSRKGKRRAHNRLALPTLVPCPRCRAPHLAYRVCPSCGTYAGRAILEPKTAKK